MCYSWLPSLACRGNTDDLISRLDTASGAVVSRRRLRSHAAPVISALLWVWMDVSPSLKSKCKRASSSRNICGGENVFLCVPFFGLCCSLGKNKAEFLYFHWMCVRGHYLAENCSFDQDGVEQKGACVGLSGWMYWKQLHWGIILNAILPQCMACWKNMFFHHCVSQLWWMTRKPTFEKRVLQYFWTRLVAPLQ